MSSCCGCECNHLPEDSPFVLMDKRYRVKFNILYYNLLCFYGLWTQVFRTQISTWCPNYVVSWSSVILVNVWKLIPSQIFVTRSFLSETQGRVLLARPGVQEKELDPSGMCLLVSFCTNVVQKLGFQKPFPLTRALLLWNLISRREWGIWGFNKASVWLIIHSLLRNCSLFPTNPMWRRIIPSRHSLPK